MPIVDFSPYSPEQLTEQAAYLRQVAAWIEGIASYAASHPKSSGAAMRAGTPAEPPPANLPTDNGGRHPPIADRTTFSARWDGKTCHLGNTITFRLLERLARRANQFVSCDVLLQEVWEGRRSREAVRSAVKVLRQKLTSAGMGRLADAIDGNTAHHYRLSLNGRF